MQILMRPFRYRLRQRWTLRSEGPGARLRLSSQPPARSTAWPTLIGLRRATSGIDRVKREQRDAEGDVLKADYVRPTGDGRV